jgi:hypothetical protein
VSVGKFGYAPYEQIRMGQCSPKSDLYALAVTAVVMLTGKSPNLLIDPRSLDWVWQSQVRLHPRFTEILEKMMAEKPQDRYSSAKLVMKDLQLLDAISRRSASRSPQSSPQLQNGQKGGQRPSGGQKPQSNPPQRNQKPHHSPNILTQNQLNPTGIKLVSAPYHLDTGHLQSIVQPIAAGVSTSARGAATAVALPRTESPAELVTKLVTLANQTCPQVLTEILPSGLYALDEETQTDLPLQHSTATPIAFTIAAPRSKVLVQQAAGKPWARLKTAMDFKALLACGLLALLPVSGVLVGVRSPQIASVCQALHNCADDQPETRYRQAMEQARGAKSLLDHAQTVTDLQRVRDGLVNALSQLEALPANAKVYAEAQQTLLHYQGLLRSVESDLNTEIKAAQLLKRAEAEAQKASEQTQLARSVSAYRTARSQWSRVLATLNAIGKNSFARPQVVARMQEYTARLETVDLRIPQSSRPHAQPELPSTTIVQFAANPSQGTFASGATVPSDPSQVASQPPATPASQPVQQLISSSQISRSQLASPNHPAPRAAASSAQSPAQSSGSVSSEATPRSTPSPIQTVPSSQQAIAAPAQIAAAPRSSLPQLIASGGSDNIPSTGSVQLSAFQQLNNVSLGLNGAWINPGGTYVANLVMQNDSDRTFGFVPLFAEVKDASGQPVHARILLRGSENGMIQPGGTLRAQLYLLDRRWITAGNQNLTLVIHEGTTGSRDFNLAF